jgi:hypothetical protein
LAGGGEDCNLVVHESFFPPPGTQLGRGATPALPQAHRQTRGPKGKTESVWGGGGGYLEILHFLRPPSSATAAATPEDFLFFFTGIFHPPRQGGQGSRGTGWPSGGGPSARRGHRSSETAASGAAKSPAHSSVAPPLPVPRSPLPGTPVALCRWTPRPPLTRRK